jgi:hypothetical protein
MSEWGLARIVVLEAFGSGGLGATGSLVLRWLGSGDGRDD